jgi:hypothetical protein
MDGVRKGGFIYPKGVLVRLVRCPEDPWRKCFGQGEKVEGEDGKKTNWTFCRPLILFVVLGEGRGAGRSSTGNVDRG